MKHRWKSLQIKKCKVNSLVKKQKSLFAMKPPGFIGKRPGFTPISGSKSVRLNAASGRDAYSEQNFILMILALTTGIHTGRPHHIHAAV